MKHGDFTQLADNYAKYRPGYSPFVCKVLLGLIAQQHPRVADMGAGTGIWSRMLAKQGCTVTAVEPNEAMLEHGVDQSANLDVQWVKGSAEQTGLPTGSFDLVSMASSFHWPDYDQACKELDRLLKPGGYFTALWNTRFIQVNPLLVEIEETLNRMVPGMKRISSGRSDFCKKLLNRLQKLEWARDVIYIEGNHVEIQSKEHYVNLWRSVNDVRVQAGPERFQKFIDYIEDRIRDEDCINATYATTAWIVEKV